MSEFNLQKCIAGEAVENQIGTPFTFVAFDKNLEYPLIMRINGVMWLFSKDGDHVTNLPAHKLRMVDQKKKVDLSKLPVDTLMSVGKAVRCFSHYEDGKFYLFADGGNHHTMEDSYDYPSATIAPNQPWTFWQGGECPIPDGLEFEVVTRGNAMLSMHVDASLIDWSFNKSGLHSMNEIIAYRLTGRVLNGWELS